MIEEIKCRCDFAECPVILNPTIRAKHFEECKFMPVRCPNTCGKKILRFELPNHRKLCPREKLKCVHADCEVNRTFSYFLFGHF